MAKFKVGDRVRPTADNASTVNGQWRRNWAEDYGESDGTYFVRNVVDLPGYTPSIGISNVNEGTFVVEWHSQRFELVTEHKFKVGDVVNNDYCDYTIAKLITKHGSPAVEYTDGGWDFEKGIKLVSSNEPTPLHVTLGIDLNPPRAPQVGDEVLIKGTLAGITTSHRGTNYNIVFETQNRRVSLHFLEEDFILDDRDCACADNDNGPPPFSGDRAKAFDALGSWLNSLAVSRAA